MSDKELPEPEGGAVPLIVLGTAGLVGLFFIGLIASVLMQKPPEEPAPSSEAEMEGLKQPAELLGGDDAFRVHFETSAGSFVVQVNPEWAPRGATQFRELVEAGFFDENRFFRVVPGFVVQFGINGDPEVHGKWQQPIPDDPVKHSNTKGTITFATSGPNTRSTQFFINLNDNARLDSDGFSPFGEVVEGMENVEKINPEYKEEPQQPQIESAGNAYLMQNFPRLDYIKSAKIVE